MNTVEVMNSVEMLSIADKRLIVDAAYDSSRRISLEVWRPELCVYLLDSKAVQGMMDDIIAEDEKLFSNNILYENIVYDDASSHKCAVLPTSFTLSGPRGRIVTIYLDDGRVDFGPEYDLDEAAKAFWTGVGLWRSTNL